MGVGAAAAVNYLLWKEVSPKGAKIGEIKVGEKADGTALLYDTLQFTGARRGMKAMGVDAPLEMLRKGTSMGQMQDNEFNDLVHTIEHPAMGPGMSFLHTTLTGKNTLGMPLSKKVTPAEKEKGFAQWHADMWAALRNMNPPTAVYLGADRPDKPVDSNRYLRLLGPLAPKERKPGR